ncbi:hypothetical protein [Paenibacillus montanisoli]|nr:hypothetical protein [Paenibacillus montanisoli]
MARPADDSHREIEDEFCQVMRMNLEKAADRICDRQLFDVSAYS